MSKAIGLTGAVLACVMSNGAIQMIDAGNKDATIVLTVITIVFATIAWAGLTPNKRKEDNNGKQF